MTSPPSSIQGSLPAPSIAHSGTDSTGSKNMTMTMTSMAGSSCTSTSKTTSCMTITSTTARATIPVEAASVAPSKGSSETESECPQTRTIPNLSNQERYRRHILSLTNRLRAAEGAAGVRLDGSLNEVARLHNLDVARNLGELSHVSSDGRTLTERMLEQGYDFRYASENLARGQRDCKWVMNSWMKSPGHRRNVLNERVKEMGLSVGVWNGKMYWCQVFGVRRR